MHYLYEKQMSVIRNLPSYLKASYAREGSAAKDYAMNRCLKQISRIQGASVIPKADKDSLLREAWEIYMDLQDWTGDERPDYNAKREVPLSLIDVDTLVEKGGVSSDSPDIRSGGLGYRHVDWNSTYLLARDGSEVGHLGSYWRPTKAKPCLVYTKEQIAGLNDGSLHYGDIEGSFEQIHS